MEMFIAVYLLKKTKNKQIPYLLGYSKRAIGFKCERKWIVVNGSIDVD